jgi:hypothetical protein
MLGSELLARENIEVPPRPRFSRFVLTDGRYKNGMPGAISQKEAGSHVLPATLTVRVENKRQRLKFAASHCPVLAFSN